MRYFRKSRKSPPNPPPQEASALPLTAPLADAEAEEEAAPREPGAEALSEKVRQLEAELERLRSQPAEPVLDEPSADDSLDSGRFLCCESPQKATSSFVALRPGEMAVSRKGLIITALAFGLQTALLVGTACAYLSESQQSEADLGTKDAELEQKTSRLVAAESKITPLKADLQKAEAKERYWENRFEEKPDEYAKIERFNKAMPYKFITGMHGHVFPELYGKVSEKTIWAYWYHPKNCPTSKDCVLPTVVQLCKETIERNKGGFDFRIVHMDEVPKYVTRIELPMRWRQLIPAHQKDSLMNALLSRYGGVAMDISTILLRPLDSYWEEMVSSGATFRGYMYRINGQPWRHAETTSVWFLMSRREGIFSLAARNQVVGMGDRNETGAYHHWYLALGDQTLTPILHMFNYSLPRCTQDPTIMSPPPAAVWDQKASMCPELEATWDQADIGTARNDTRLLLRDPREGPQLPFAFGKGMATWNVSDPAPLTEEQIPSDMRVPGAPMQSEKCSSAKDCWGVFLERLHRAPEPRTAPVLSFVKLFAHARELKGLSREQIFNLTDSFVVQWLKLAGLEN